MFMIVPAFKKSDQPEAAGDMQARLQKYPTKADIMSGGDSIYCANCLTELTGTAEDSAQPLYNDR